LRWILVDLGIIAGLGTIILFPLGFIFRIGLSLLFSILPKFTELLSPISLLSTTGKATIIILYYVLKKLYTFDIFKKFVRNPNTTSVENCKLNIKHATSSELGWEVIAKLQKDIRKWEKEKRDFLLSHEE